MMANGTPAPAHGPASTSQLRPHEKDLIDAVIRPGASRGLQIPDRVTDDRAYGVCRTTQREGGENHRIVA